LGAALGRKGCLMQVTSLSSKSHSNLAAVVKAAQQGDRDSFEGLVERTHKMLRRLALPLLPASLVEDALQETYVLMFQKLHYLKDPSAFRSWLSRIALHACYDLLRKARPTESLSNQHEEAAQPDEPLDVVAIRSALAKLKKKDRNILILREYLDTSYDEIGEILDLAPGTVKSRLFYARKKMKEYVAQDEVLKGLGRLGA
jgi:RNA polymerase sigma-70 factor (ECF subfamily)